MKVIRFLVFLIIIFLLGLGIDYIFVVLDKRKIIEFGSFLHILANGSLIFVPLMAVNRRNSLICLFSVFISAFAVFSPIVIIRYDYVTFLSVAVYTVFAVYIACKKTRHIGVR